MAMPFQNLISSNPFSIIKREATPDIKQEIKKEVTRYYNDKFADHSNLTASDFVVKKEPMEDSKQTD